VAIRISCVHLPFPQNLISFFLFLLTTLSLSFPPVPTLTLPVRITTSVHTLRLYSSPLHFTQSSFHRFIVSSLIHGPCFSLLWFAKLSGLCQKKKKTDRVAVCVYVRLFFSLTLSVIRCAWAVLFLDITSSSLHHFVLTICPISCFGGCRAVFLSAVHHSRTTLTLI